MPFNNYQQFILNIFLFIVQNHQFNCITAIYKNQALYGYFTVYGLYITCMYKNAPCFDITVVS